MGQLLPTFGTQERPVGNRPFLAILGINERDERTSASKKSTRIVQRLQCWRLRPDRTRSPFGGSACEHQLKSKWSLLCELVT